MTTKTNQLDIAADILAEYVDEMSTKAAEVLTSKGAPFAADVSQDELMEYYHAQLFNPDGSVNAQGRMAQIQRLGPEGFAKMFKKVTGTKRDESFRAPVPPIAPPPPPMPMGPPMGPPMMPPPIPQPQGAY